MVKTCSVEQCGRRSKAKGLCPMHYMRMRTGAEMHAPARGRHGRIMAGSVSYSTTHYRLRREIGPASSHRCSQCGMPADEWAYQGGAPDEMTGPNGVSGKPHTYSAIAAYYKPLCQSCHRKLDGIVPPRRTGRAL